LCTYLHTKNDLEYVAKTYSIHIDPKQPIIKEESFSNKRKRNEDEFDRIPLVSPKSSSTSNFVTEKYVKFLEKCIEDSEEKEHQFQKLSKEKNIMEDDFLRKIRKLEERLDVLNNDYQHINKKYKDEQKLRFQLEAELNSYKLLKSIPGLTNNK
jgi:predicted transcriptional regulator